MMKARHVTFGSLLVISAGAPLLLANDVYESQKLVYVDPVDEDFLGRSVGIAGERVFAGASRRDIDWAGDNRGAVAMFTRSSGAFIGECSTFGFPVPLHSSFLGSTLAVGGGVVVAGAPEDDGGGSVRVFDATTGQEIAIFTTPFSPGRANLGRAVAVSGQWAVAGEIDQLAANNAGSALIFDARTGAELRRLFAADAASDDQFGWSVGVSGDTIVVGAPYDDDLGSNSGSAYVFSLATGQQLSKLRPEGEGSGGWFGWSVAVVGNRALVGSYSRGVYLFDLSDPSLPVLIRRLAPIDGGGQFGYAVAMSSEGIVVGAPYKWVDGIKSGSAELFDRDGIALARLLPSDPEHDARFVAIDGLRTVVGADYSNEGAPHGGAAYVFAPPCFGDADGDGEVGFVDLNLVLTLWGSDNPIGDVEANGAVDFGDLNLVLDHWNSICPN